MRARNIKPGFFNDEELLELPPLTRLLFAGLWCLADREGRLPDKPKRIKIEVLPCDDCDVDAALQSLHDCGRIERYEVDGNRYIQVANFLKHQKPHMNEVRSTIPAPTKVGASTNQGSAEHLPRQVPIALIPDSGYLIPDSGSRKAEEEAEEERAPDWNPFGEAPERPPTDTIEAYITHNISSRITSGMVGKLDALEADGATPELIRYAVDAACETAKGPPSWNLFETILRNWLSEGVRTVGEAKAAQDAHKARKEQGRGANHRQDSADDPGRRSGPPGSAGNRYKPDPAEIERIARERGIL